MYATRKMVLSVATAGIVLLAAAGCGADPESSDGLTLVSIGVGSPQVEHTLPEVARELGLFEKHGIDAKVELIPTGGQTVTAALLGGSLDYGVFGSPALEQAVSQGADLKSIATWMHVLAAGFVGADGIDSIEDLAGEPVAVSAPSGLSGLFTDKTLRDAGLDPQTGVKRQNVQGMANALSAFISGQVKGAMLGGVQIAAALEQTPGSKVLTDYAQEGYAWPVSELVTSGSVVADDPETVEKVVAALQEAAEAFQDPAQAEEITAIIAKFIQLDESSVKTQLEVVSKYIDPTLAPREEDHQNVLEQLALYDSASEGLEPSDVIVTEFTESE